MPWLFVLLYLFTFTFSVRGEELPKSVQAELLANVAKIKAGDAFMVGVLLKIDTGWHIYWKNSGDTGLPTSLSLTFLDGFRAGPVLWPVPVSFSRSGGIIDYGYEKSVMLLSEVEAPSKLSHGSAIPVNAEVSWVSCEEICIAGVSNLGLTLPVGDSTHSANERLFNEWEKRLPVDADSPDSPFLARIKRNAGSQDKSLNFTVSLDWRLTPTDVEWFPVAGRFFDVRNILVRTKGRQGIITFTAELLPGQNLHSNVLETVVAYTNSKGERSGVNLPIQLEKANNPYN